MHVIKQNRIILKISNYLVIKKLEGFKEKYFSWIQVFSFFCLLFKNIYKYFFDCRISHSLQHWLDPLFSKQDNYQKPIIQSTFYQPVNFTFNFKGNILAEFGQSIS